MKTAEEWLTQFVGRSFSMRDMLAMFRSIQADALAAAAKACEEQWRDARGSVMHDDYQRAGDACADLIRKLKPKA